MTNHKCTLSDPPYQRRGYRKKVKEQIEQVLPVRPQFTEKWSALSEEEKKLVIDAATANWKRLDKRIMPTGDIKKTVRDHIHAYVVDDKKHVLDSSWELQVTGDALKMAEEWKAGLSLPQPRNTPSCFMRDIVKQREKIFTAEDKPAKSKKEGRAI